jgi:hypothetical protein
VIAEADDRRLVTLGVTVATAIAIPVTFAARMSIVGARSVVFLLVGRAAMRGRSMRGLCVRGLDEFLFAMPMILAMTMIIAMPMIALAALMPAAVATVAIVMRCLALGTALREGGGTLG